MLWFRRAQVVFVLVGVLVPTLCCDWLKRYTDLSDRCLSLLRDLGGPITNKEFPLPFPRKLYQQVKKSEAACKVTFVRNNLGHILDLYEQVNVSRVGWDADNLEELLIVVHRQKAELSACISPAKMEGCFSKELRHYYGSLTNATLNGTEGSSASWELIRSETKMHLQKLHLLVAAM
ncbi:interferon phi 1 [Syngnathus acus]|uniref:interferon phi 1 n=1 Tax=Syngnathus acus TaxID=161584 RepID=UPI0018862D18|nr:interferon phi 1 [Syngnathus acus]